MKNLLEKARRFIYRNARPVDFARWQFHFENGKPDDVWKAMEAYQNEDGGFGHAIEPDFWNPNSTPIGTWVATELIRETGLTDAKHPLIRGILHYLESGKDFVDGTWLNTVASNNDYPHACWWEHNETDYRPTYNPTASLAGFAIRFAEQGSPLYERCCDIAVQAVGHFVSGAVMGMHEVSCFIRLDCCLRESHDKIVDLTTFEARLKEVVDSIISREPDTWMTEYVCLPSRFIESRHSIFYQGNEALVQRECEIIQQAQQPDGTYPVTWQWGNDYKEFEISANWWKTDILFQKLLFLQAMQA